MTYREERRLLLVFVSTAFLLGLSVGRLIPSPTSIPIPAAWVETCGRFAFVLPAILLLKSLRGVNR